MATNSRQVINETRAEIAQGCAWPTRASVVLTRLWLFIMGCSDGDIF